MRFFILVVLISFIQPGESPEWETRIKTDQEIDAVWKDIGVHHVYHYFKKEHHDLSKK